jgi:hypothetical protein
LYTKKFRGGYAYGQKPHLGDHNHKTKAEVWQRPPNATTRNTPGERVTEDEDLEISTSDPTKLMRVAVTAEHYQGYLGRKEKWAIPSQS